MTGLRRLFTLLMTMALVSSACTGDGGTTDDGSGGTGDAPGTQENVTLDFWVFKEIESGAFYDTLVSEFEAAHPNIDVELTSYPEENYDVKIDTSVAADKAPDLMLNFGPQYPREGLLLPVDAEMAERGVDLSTFSPAIMGEGGEFGCGYEGRIYCVGSYLGISALVYNKGMFDEAGIPHPAPWPPMTPDEFVDIACRLTDKENGVWGGGAADPMAYLPWEIFFSEDGRTATGYVNGPEAVHQFEVLGDGYARGCFPSLNVMDPWIQGRDYVASGQLGMAITDYLDLRTLDNAGIEYGSTAPPTPDGYEPYFFSWSDAVGVISKSDTPEEAMDFVAFMATNGGQIRFETTGDIPLDAAVADEVNWAKGIPGREDGLELASHARPSIFVPNRWDVLGPLWDAWGYIVAGEKTAQEALDEVAPAVQENLDKAWEDWEGA